MVSIDMCNNRTVGSCEASGVPERPVKSPGHHVVFQEYKFLSNLKYYSYDANIMLCYNLTLQGFNNIY